MSVTSRAPRRRSGPWLVRAHVVSARNPCRPHRAGTGRLHPAPAGGAMCVGERTAHREASRPAGRTRPVTPPSSLGLTDPTEASLRFGATTTARTGGFAGPRGLRATESPDRSLSTRSRAQDGEAPHPIRLVATARAGPSEQDRQATYDAARAICVVALLEAAEAATARTAT